MAPVFAIPSPGDVVDLSFQGKGGSIRKRSRAMAPVSFKLIILSHMQESRNRATRYIPGAVIGEVITPDSPKVRLGQMRCRRIADPGRVLRSRFSKPRALAGLPEGCAIRKLRLVLQHYP